MIPFEHHRIRFLLPKHTLCKENIVIMKKFELKCLIVIKCSESRVETLQIFRKVILFIYLFFNSLPSSTNDKISQLGHFSFCQRKNH